MVNKTLFDEIREDERNNLIVKMLREGVRISVVERITNLTIEEIKQIKECYSELETKTLQLTTEEIAPQKIEEIEELFKEARENIKRSDFIGFKENNKALQNALRLLKR